MAGEDKEMQEDPIFRGEILAQKSLFSRLYEELNQAWIDVRSDPAGFLENLKSSTGPGTKRRRDLVMAGLAVAILCYSAGFVVVLVLWSPGRSAVKPSFANFVPLGPITFPGQPPVDRSRSRKERTDEGGGGGGGRES